MRTTKAMLAEQVKQLSEMLAAERRNALYLQQRRDNETKEIIRQRDEAIRDRERLDNHARWLVQTVNSLLEIAKTPKAIR